MLYYITQGMSFNIQNPEWLIKRTPRKKIERNLVKDVILLHRNSFLMIYIKLIILAQCYENTQHDSNSAVLSQMV